MNNEVVNLLASEGHNRWETNDEAGQTRWLSG